MRVVAVLGTRPEVIKLAPVIAELRAQDTETVVVSTGQHRELLDQMLEQFELEPDVDLGVMRPEQRLADLTAALVRGLGDAVGALEPDWVLVQGDTSTTLCGALAAFYETVPVAHVEAGLRSGDNHSPFPEEANRRLVARLARLHFCPTPGSASNLILEGRRVLLTLHRRESQGESMRRVCDAVWALSRRGDIEIVFPVHRSPAVRDVVVPRLENCPGVHLCDPLDYLSLIHVLDSSDLVLTDSGGLQEEGPALGKPVLVLRDTTERPEAIEAGVARLVGTNPDVIFRSVARLLDDPLAYAQMAHPENPFGDGLASRRIVAALADRERLPRAA